LHSKDSETRRIYGSILYVDISGLSLVRDRRRSGTMETTGTAGAFS